MHGRALLIAGAALLIGTSSASAATPIDLGPTDSAPNIALDPAGAAHVTWVTSTALKYCRIDAGGSGCAASTTFPTIVDFTQDEGNAPLIDSAGHALVLSARYYSTEARFLYSSVDGFASRTTVATDGSGFTSALYAPAGTLNAAARIVTAEGGPDTYGGTVQASGITGTTGDSFHPANGNSTVAESLALQGSTLYVAYIDQTDDYRIYWRRYSGDGSLASLNDGANWSAPAAFAAGFNSVVLASGPSGLYAAYDDGTSGAVMLTKLTGNTWSAPVALTSPDVINGWFGFSEDSTGVLHLAWNDSTGALLYSYGRDASNGAFTRPQTLVASGSFRDPELVVGGSGDGWVSYRDFDTDRTTVIPVAPGEPPAPGDGSTPPPGGGGAPQPAPGSGGGAGTPVPPATTPTPTPPASPTRATTVQVKGGGSITFGTPRACVAPGHSFSVTLSFKRSKKKGSVFVKVSRVDFTVQGTKVKTDTRAPFKQTLKVVAGAKPGSHVTVRARATIKVHHGKAPKKSISAQVAVCG